MKNSIIATGVIHEVPDDLKATLTANPAILEKWNALTPLARNEWICWATVMPKKPETREQHLTRLSEELLDGKRRPCCWPGCPHRNPNAQKWFK